MRLEIANIKALKIEINSFFRDHNELTVKERIWFASLFVNHILDNKLYTNVRKDEDSYYVDYSITNNIRDVAQKVVDWMAHQKQRDEHFIDNLAEDKFDNLHKVLSYMEQHPLIDEYGTA